MKSQETYQQPEICDIKIVRRQIHMSTVFHISSTIISYVLLFFIRIYHTFQDASDN